MNLFHYISKKWIEKGLFNELKREEKEKMNHMDTEEPDKKNHFSEEWEEWINVVTHEWNLLKIIFDKLSIHSKHFIQGKYLFLEQNLENIFYSAEFKEKFMDLFSKTQRTYFALERLGLLYRLKKLTFTNQEDMMFNPIDIKKRNTILLYHNKNKYMFIVSDILNILIQSLTYSSGFSAQPLVFKNPYNNLCFLKSHLYTLYFTMFFRSIPIPEMIQHYFQCNFDIDLFQRKNEELVRDYIIKKHVVNTPNYMLYSHIMNMFHEYNKRHKKIFKIHNKFPMDKLVEIMKPYLDLYYQSIHGFNYQKRKIAQTLLDKKLFILKTYNSSFGKKIVRIHFKKTPKQSVFEKKVTILKTHDFSDHHPPFYLPQKKKRNQNKKFLTSHIGIDQRSFFVISNRGASNRNIQSDSRPEINEWSNFQSEYHCADSDDESENEEDENDVEQNYLFNMDHYLSDIFTPRMLIERSHRNVIPQYDDDMNTDESDEEVETEEHTGSSEAVSESTSTLFAPSTSLPIQNQSQSSPHPFYFYFETESNSSDHENNGTDSEVLMIDQEQDENEEQYEDSDENTVEPSAEPGSGAEENPSIIPVDTPIENPIENTTTVEE